jgi:DNA-binding FrmR family transcriptional regulator
VTTTIEGAKQRSEVILRLKRIEGQLRGIQAMIEAGADCEKVVQQITASRRALDKAFFHVLACAVQGAPEPGAPASASGRARDKRLRHAAELLAKFG